jgi:hypothetical protein
MLSGGGGLGWTRFEVVLEVQQADGSRGAAPVRILGEKWRRSNRRLWAGSGVGAGWRKAWGGAGWGRSCSHGRIGFCSPSSLPTSHPMYFFSLSFSSFAANLDRSNHKFLTHMTRFLVNDDGCLRPHLMEDGRCRATSSRYELVFVLDCRRLRN